MSAKTQKNVSDYLGKLVEEADKESKETGEEFEEYTTEYEKGFKNRILSKYNLKED